MERTQDNPPVCRSIFLSGSSTTSAAFTRKWVASFSARRFEKPEESTKNEADR